MRTKLRKIVNCICIILGLVMASNFVASADTFSFEKWDSDNDDTAWEMLANTTWDEIMDVICIDTKRNSVIDSGEILEDMVYYSQGDPQWGSEKYGNGGGTIATSGCGVTCMAMAVATFANGSVNPLDMARLSEANGAYYSGQGTAMGVLVPKTVAKYNMKWADLSGKGEQAIKDALNEGKLVIWGCVGHCMFSSSSAGHVMILRKTSGDKFYLADPGKNQRNNIGYTWSQINGNAKGYYYAVWSDAGRLESLRKYSDEDLQYLAAIIDGMASGSSKKGKIAFGYMIMNRVKSDDFPDTIKQVVEDGDFPCVKKESKWKKKLNGTYTSKQSKEIALQILRKEIKNPIKGMCYFSDKAAAEYNQNYSRSSKSNYWTRKGKDYIFFKTWVPGYPRFESEIPDGDDTDDETFVKVKDYIPNIQVDLRYASTNNFTGKKIYTFNDAYLRYGTVKKLKKVQESLEAKGMSLKIWDAFRPTSAQWTLWEVYPDGNYVANPNNGYSSHSKGNTVDITVVDSNGNEITMPTGFDDFTAMADRDYSDCSTTAAANAKMLEDLMEDNGFTGYSAEWWHFSDNTSYDVDDSFEP